MDAIEILITKFAFDSIVIELLLKRDALKQMPQNSLSCPFTKKQDEAESG